MLKFVTEHGLGLFLVEYRGYGVYWHFFAQLNQRKKEEMQPNLGKMLGDIPAIYKALTNRGVQESEMLLYGRSMGALFAVHFASLYSFISSLLNQPPQRLPTVFLSHPNVAGLITESGVSQLGEFLAPRIKKYGDRENPQIKFEEIEEELKKETSELVDGKAKLSAFTVLLFSLT